MYLISKADKVFRINTSMRSFWALQKVSFGIAAILVEGVSWILKREWLIGCWLVLFSFALSSRRASFYACRLDKNLYVIGGRNETGYLSSVECYNLETNEWRYVSSLPQPLAAHAGAVHNGKIYISGQYLLQFPL